MADAPRWVAAGLATVPPEVICRYVESDERGRLRRLDDRVTARIPWHPVAAGILVASLMALPLLGIAIGVGSSTFLAWSLVACIAVAVVVVVSLRWQLKHVLLPTLALLRPDAVVPFGYEPHLYYLAGWASSQPEPSDPEAP